MNRILFATLTAATLAAAAPAAAFSYAVDFPVLTFPPQPTPETTQGCTDLTTTVQGETCTAPAK
ncbi:MULTISPECIES: hypothetical protein [unclassified Yoonia]|uniref:hypothetical protein n=1 Tax=unclassified Yoonia TaxID=2629118 RepID=UPI00372963C1